MGAWGKWFESIKENVVDMGGHFSVGREISSEGTKDLPLGLDSITGFTIVSAENLDDAAAANATAQETATSSVKGDLPEGITIPGENRQLLLECQHFDSGESHSRDWTPIF